MARTVCRVLLPGLFFAALCFVSFLMRREVKNVGPPTCATQAPNEVQNVQGATLVIESLSDVVARVPQFTHDELDSVPFDGTLNRILEGLHPAWEKSHKGGCPDRIPLTARLRDLHLEELRLLALGFSRRGTRRRAPSSD